MPSADDQPITPDSIIQGGGLSDDAHEAAEPEAFDPLAAFLGGDGGGAGGGFDLGSLMATASQMQEQLMAAQAETAETVVEGVAGGGAVKVAVTGALEFQSVTIAPSAVDPDDVELLQDLVLAALRDAADKIQDLQSDAVDLGGLDLGGLFGGR